MLRDRLKEFRLVSESAIERGVKDLFTEETIVAEGASATSLAGMRQSREELRGKTVALPISGRNLSPERFRRIIGTDR